LLAATNNGPAAAGRPQLCVKKPYAYDNADMNFLRLVANQVAVAVENALAFEEIAALKDQLAKENAYLEQEVRTEHNFGEIVGDSAILRQVLKQVETVAPTASTVLIRGENGYRQGTHRPGTATS